MAIFRQPRKGEPRFTLLASDPNGYQALEVWANMVEQAIADGTRPPEDKALVVAARELVIEMRDYLLGTSPLPDKPIGKPPI